MRSAIVLVLLLNCCVLPASAEFPETPDALVEALESAIETLDPDAYEELLDWSYLFDFAPEHAWLSPPFGEWNWNEEMRAMRAMLSGAPMNDGTLRTVRAITMKLDPLGEWEPGLTPDELRIDVYTRSYASKIVIELDDGSETMISRRQRFTVAAGRSEATMQTGAYRLVRWEELEARNRFGAMKARF